MQVRHSLTLANAQAIVTAALAAPRSSPPRPIAIAVCDAGGHPLALAREAEAPPLLAHIAMAKAFTCVAYGKATADLAIVADDYPTWFNGISRTAQSSMGMPLIGSKGGVMIRDASGQVIGAVGVAGETGELDDAIAKRGVAAAGCTT